MPSLINRVTSFGQSKKGQSLIQQAVGRFTGGKGSRKGGRRRAGGNRRSRVARKR